MIMRDEAAKLEKQKRVEALRKHYSDPKNRERLVEKVLGKDYADNFSMWDLRTPTINWEAFRKEPTNDDIE